MHFLALAVLMTLVGLPSGTTLAAERLAQAPPQPSYDCRRARLPTEIAICGSHELSRLDVQMSDLYFTRKSQSSYSAQNWMKQDQKAWLRGRNGCGYNADCIRRYYLERIRVLSE